MIQLAPNQERNISRSRLRPLALASDGMMDWSESDFRDRIEARIRQLGLPETTLLKAAGLSGDEIRKTPKRGRRIDTIVGIARALRWTLGQAIGIQDPTLFLDREREIDPARLAKALEIVDQALDGAEVPANVLADAASLVYSTLAEAEANGCPPDHEQSRQLIESLVRRVYTWSLTAGACVFYFIASFWSATRASFFYVFSIV